MKKIEKIVIFDFDMTVTNVNTPYYIFQSWAKQSFVNKMIFFCFNILQKIIFINKFQRITEYLLVPLIEDQDLVRIANQIILDDKILNTLSLNRIKKYKRNKIKIFVVTAAPNKVIKPICDMLYIDTVIGSEIRFGLTIKDLQGKKKHIYKKIIEKSFFIQSIYSDQLCDLSPLAKKNFLVGSHSIKLQNK